MTDHEQRARELIQAVHDGAFDCGQWVSVEKNGYPYERVFVRAQAPDDSLLA